MPSNYPFKLGAATVWAYGKPENFRVQDWNRRESFSPIFRILKSLEIARTIIPIPGFDATVRAAHNMPLKHQDGSCTILTGRRADGMLLRRGEACAIASADCHTTVIWNKHASYGAFNMAVLHTGRDPLFPAHLRAVKRKHGDREEQSVIDVLLQQTGWNPKHLHVRICVGIDAHSFQHPFDHPVYGNLNRMRARFAIKHYGAASVVGERNNCLDTVHINRTMWEQKGVAQEHIRHDELNTASLDEEWWSKRNNEEGRNLIVVAN